MSQAASMEQRHTPDGGSVMRAQKHDNRINKDLLVKGSSDMAGDVKKRDTDDKTITASSTPSGRVYFKRGVQPKCGVQVEKCGVQD